MKLPPSLKNQQQLKELELFKFFQGQGALPSDFELEYICDILKITYTELMKQPAEWVEKMIVYYRQKSISEAHTHKIQQAKAKAQAGKKPVGKR